MQTTSKHWLRFGIVVVLVTNAGLAPAAAADTTPVARAATAPGVSLDGHVALTGRVLGVAEVDVDDVFAFVKPEKKVEASIQQGEPATYYRLPAGSVRVTGNSYALVVEPEDLPDWTISSSGLATFHVLAQDDATSTFGVVSTSARSVQDGLGSTAWVDPLVATNSLARSTTGDLGPGSGSVLDPVTANIQPAVSGILCDGEACEGVSERGVPFVDVTEHASSSTVENSITMAAAAEAAGSSSTTSGGCGTVYGRDSNRSSTIGTAYPIRKDTAWMTFTRGSSHEFSASYGVAGNTSGRWEQSRSESLDRSFGFEWDPKRYIRSFRVAVKYRNVRYYYDRCPPSKPYHQTWVPVSYTGGVGENRKGVSRPSWWTHQARIRSTGIWWRKSAQGNAYSLSYGVKFSNVLGIDLSSRRAYNQEAKLAYRIRGKRWMFGNDADPAVASKVVSRVRRYPPCCRQP